MSFGLFWRASLATAAGLVFGFLALRFINEGDRSSPSQNSFIPRLSLIRQASTGELISLEIGPFEVGPNDFRVTLLNAVGKPQKLSSARLRFSRMEARTVVDEVDSTPAGQSRQSSVDLSGPGWWQIEVIVNTDSTAPFYLKLDQPSSAPKSFAPPDYAPDAEAEQLFRVALLRYESLTGLKQREELTSGDPGPSGHGIWFITDINSNRDGYHATSLSMGQGASELYSDPRRQCFRQGRDEWQCSEGAAPVGPFDLGYLQNATGFKNGPQEPIDGEMTQTIFFYNGSQGAWYVWWIGEQSHYVRRQAMVANGHFMLDRFSNHDAPVSIQPKDLPVQ